MKGKLVVIVMWCLFFVIVGRAQAIPGNEAAGPVGNSNMVQLPRLETPAIVYVSNAAGGITEVNAADNSILATAPFPNNANSVAVTPDGKRLYASNRDVGKVTVFDTATNVPLADIAVGGSGDNLGVAASPDGQFVYLANQFSGTVTVIATATNTVTRAIPTGIEPIWITFSPDGANAYVSNQVSGTLSVIATATQSVIGTVSGFACPFQSAFTRDARFLFVSSQCDNSVKVVDPSTNNVVNSIPTGPNPRGIAFTPDGARAYVANFFSNTVDVLDARAQVNLGRPVTVGQKPWGLAMTPDGKAYVANFASSTISVIDTAANAVTATLRARVLPEDVTISTSARPRILNYSFEAFDVPGATETVARDINDRGVIAGFFTDGNAITHGFVRSAQGEITAFDAPGAVSTTASAINARNVVAGFYVDATGRFHGFERDPDGLITTVDSPGAPDTFLLGINNQGDVVGGIDLGDQTTSIGLLLQGGKFSTFEDPSAAPMQTQPNHINETGLITGLFVDSAGQSHGFLLNTAEYTTLDFPGADATFALGTSNRGTSAGQYITNFPVHGFLLDEKGFFSFDFPNSRASGLRRVNEAGQIVGAYRLFGSNARHAFVATQRGPQ
jgi:YVTN family beta-propeller protein